jgi:ribosomal protein S18 acetylase RimI-like enzyme
VSDAGSVLPGLRRAVPADADAVAEVVGRAYEHYVEHIGVTPAPMLDDYARVIEEHEVWVLEEADGLAAALVLVPKSGHLFVDNVAVHPAFQGHGLGRALLDLAAARAGDLGVSEMRLYTNAMMTENIALYRRLGWEETDRKHDGGYDRVFMRKSVE